MADWRMSGRVSLALAFAGTLSVFTLACSGSSAPGDDASNPARNTADAVVLSAVPFGPPRAVLQNRALRVIVGGDLLPHRPSLVAPAAIRASLAPLSSLFANADAVIANYEAATGDVGSKASRLAYAAPRGWLEELPKAGIGVVTVANNHACDLAEAGLEATLDSAKTSGLLALGADAIDPWAPRVIASLNGKRICAVAWTNISNAEGGCSRSRRLAVAPLTFVGKQRIDRALAKARSQCDATVAIFHGGEEYAPQTSQVLDQAGHAAEVGADVVVIHHPHIASPVVVRETKDGRKVPIFASVGNLVTNQGESWKPPMFPVLRENRRLVCVNGWTRLGVLADLSFSFDADQRAHLDWGLHLVWIDNEHAADRTATTPKIEARLLDPTRDKAIVDKLSEDARGPVALFSEPCWFERDAGTTITSSQQTGASSLPRDERCASPVGPALDGAVVAVAPGHASGHAPNKRAMSRRKK